MHNRYRGDYTSDFQEELHRQMSTQSKTYITLYVFEDGTYVYDIPDRSHYMLIVLKDISPLELRRTIKQLLLS